MALKGKLKAPPSMITSWSKKHTVTVSPPTRRSRPPKKPKTSWHRDRQAWREFKLTPSSNWANGQATFGHLIGGYDAGYYGYLSSQVYSADMFYTFFKENPMDPEQGRRYRKMILEKGGSEDENEILKAFLGRPPKGDAFYQELGIKK